MTIETLKKSYPNVLLIELNSAPSTDKFFEIKNIDDFFKLTSKVGYKIFKTQSDDTQKMAINVCLDEFYNRSTVYYSKQRFCDYVYAYIEKHDNCTLKKIFPAYEYMQLTLYALDYDFMFYINDTPYPDENHIQGINELKKLYSEFENSLKEEQEIKKKQIKDSILKYKQEYEEAKSNLARETVIKKIQYELRESFGVDGRSDPLASKTGITNLLEN